MLVLRHTTLPTAWSVAVLAVCSLVCFSQLAHQCRATATAGCVTQMMTTAGMSKPDAVSYENTLSGNRVPVSDLKHHPPYILRLFGIRNLGHASLLHVCMAGGSRRSPQCKAFKECSGHGQCQLPNSTGGALTTSPYQCQCQAGFNGSACQTNACHDACQNGANCTPTSHGQRFQCICKAGYTGQRCEKKVNRCTPNPCANGGQCRALLNDFSCECQHGYAGRRCESHLLKESEFDKKLERMTSALTTAIGDLSKAVRAGFASMNTRFASMNTGFASMNTGFASMNARLGSVNGQTISTGRSCQRSGRRGALPTSGVYTEAGFGGVRFTAFCDMVTDGGGWTVLQRRQDGSVDFFRNWTDYQKGFGSLTGEFWLGLDKIHAMTSSGKYRLRIDMITTGGTNMTATYSSFRVDNESNKYRLHVTGFKGYGASDYMKQHNGSNFSTKDRDNDLNNGSCATAYRGGWWYKSCWHSNLNGLYGRNLDWRTPNHLKFVEMKIRP